MLLLLLLLIQTPDSPDTAASAADSTADIIFYGGKRAIFLARTEEVVLLESAWVRYRDMSVYSDSIHYDIKERLLTAHGAVRFSTASQEIRGTLLAYNVDTRRGFMRLARTAVENGFFAAKEAWLVKERVLNARQATYTTCELEHPHYAFYGPQVKLLMDDIAVTQPVVLRIGRVPVLAAPFWLVPVASKRKSGLMPFKVGNATDQGYYAKNIAYYWVINDYADATFYLDFMTRKGLQFRSEAVYIVDPFARGSIQGSYIREWDTRRIRYGCNAAHSSRFLFDSQLDAQADFISDSSYAPDYGEEPLTWLKQDLYSYAALTRQFWRLGRASARVESRQDLVRHIRELSLPIAGLTLSPLRLSSAWDITPSLSFSRRLRAADSSGVDTLRAERHLGSATIGVSGPEWHLGRLHLSDAVSFGQERRWYRAQPSPPASAFSNAFSVGTSQKLFGFLNTSEDLTLTHSDIISDTVAAAPRYTVSLSGSFSLFRVFDIHRLNVHSLLHTITPGCNLSYEPQVLAGGIFGRPKPLNPDAASLSFSLGNGFQVKLGETRTKADIGRADFTTVYDLRNGRLSPLNLSASIRPLLALGKSDSGPVRPQGDIYITGQAAFDPTTLRPDSLFNITTTIRWERSLSDTRGNRRGIALNLDHTLGHRNNMLRLNTTITLSGWRVTLNSLGYNFVTSQLTDYGVAIIKDLHCWELLVNLTKVRQSFRYEFEFRIKKLPDVKFGTSTLRPFLPGR